MINVRKMLLACLMVAILAGLVYTVWEGFELNGFEVLGYQAIEKKSDELDQAIDEYNIKNENSIPSKQNILSTNIEEYYVQKAKYEETLKEKQAQLLSINEADYYDLDFIWTKVGNYARNNHLDIELNVTKNSLDQAEMKYVISDLNFTAQAFINLNGYSYDPFKNTADFINDLEEDARLEFEIRDLNMVKDEIKVIVNRGTEQEDEVETYVVKTTFTVYNVPLNKDTLTVLTSKDVTQSESLTQEGKGDVVKVTEQGEEMSSEENVSNTTF